MLLPTRGLNHGVHGRARCASNIAITLACLVSGRCLRVAGETRGAAALDGLERKDVRLPLVGCAGRLGFVLTRWAGFSAERFEFGLLMGTLVA